MYYKYDNYGRFDGTSEIETARSTTIAPDVMSPLSNWTGEKWIVKEVQERVVAQTQAPSVILSKLSFLDRFTDAELQGIYAAAKQNIAVEVWLDKFKLSNEINLKDERLIAGLRGMEAIGLLAAGRVDEILAP